ncbi:MAG TPA: hypothetical protein VFZ43_04705 [Anaerolineales bacterium]
MNELKKRLANVHPLLFAIFPILVLRNHNIIYVDLGSIMRSLIISLSLAGLLWLLLGIITKNWDRAGIITALAIILFFSYGHAHLQIQSLFGEAARHRYLLGTFGVVFIFLTAIILRSSNTSIIKQFLSVVGFLMLAFSAAQSIGHDLSAYQANRQAEAKRKQITTGLTDIQRNQALPDIYLIILDAHAGSDVLRLRYDYDNSNFIRELTDLGFYVAECSQSNYSTTKYSLTSVMNADYLQNFTNMSLMPALQESTVNQTLHSLGYITIGFENRARGHFELNEDIRLSRNKLAMGYLDLMGGPNEFEAELIQTTFLKLFYDSPQFIPGFDLALLEQAEYREHYLQTYYILEELKQIPTMPGPKFVFAHILVPHPPYIFNPEGDFHLITSQIAGYRNNVQFIDSQILPTVKAIIEQSNIPPVIIIQGDHGPSGTSVTPQLRMSILNAYYVNNETKASLYSTITPVNSFRVIFNHYFDSSYPLLDDVSYYGKSESEFTAESIVPNFCKN